MKAETGVEVSGKHDLPDRALFTSLTVSQEFLIYESVNGNRDRLF
jgi:hypothetical protein